MKARCRTCKHPDRREIEQARFGGESLRAVASRFGTSSSSLHVHFRDHVPADVKVAAARVQAAIAVVETRERGDDILSELRALTDEAKRLQAKAEAKNDIRTAISAIRELVRLVELKARVLGELRDREINITNVQIDAETAERLAAMYVARRSAGTLAGRGTVGYIPTSPSQVIDNESE